MKNKYGETLELYATHNDHLWDLYRIKGTDKLEAIPCDPNSGRQSCQFGNIDYVEFYYPRKFGTLAGYTRVSDCKQI